MPESSRVLGARGDLVAMAPRATSSSGNETSIPLAEQLKALDMSAAELARRLAVPTDRVTAIIKGQRAVTDAKSTQPVADVLNRYRRLPW